MICRFRFLMLALCRCCSFRRCVVAASGFVRLDDLGRLWTLGEARRGMWARKAR